MVAYIREHFTDDKVSFVDLEGINPVDVMYCDEDAQKVIDRFNAEKVRLRKKANDLKKLEDKIEQLENRLAEIDEEFLVPENATNVALLNDLTKERNSVEEELNTMYEQWEELSSEE